VKVGDLVKWADYTCGVPTKIHIGLFLRPITSHSGVKDIVVLYNRKEVEWCAFQCEVINENEL